MDFETDGEVKIKNPDNVHIGKNVFIGHGTFIDGYHSRGGCVEIGDGSWIGQMCYLHGAGSIGIGERVGIGPCTKILSSYHDLDCGRLHPIIGNPIETRLVRIEKNCDVGVGSIILPGVTLGEGSMVGAGSVVTKTFPEYSVVAGNPAKLLRTRK